jgi:hypothetical protein
MKLSPIVIRRGFESLAELAGVLQVKPTDAYAKLVANSDLMRRHYDNLLSISKQNINTKMRDFTQRSFADIRPTTQPNTIPPYIQQLSTPESFENVAPQQQRALAALSKRDADGRVTEPNAILKVYQNIKTGYQRIANLSQQGAKEAYDTLIKTVLVTGRPATLDQQHSLFEALYKKYTPFIKAYDNAIMDKSVKLMNNDQDIKNIMKWTGSEFTEHDAFLLNQRFTGLRMFGGASTSGAWFDSMRSKYSPEILLHIENQLKQAQQRFELQQFTRQLAPILDRINIDQFNQDMRGIYLKTVRRSIARDGLAANQLSGGFTKSVQAISWQRGATEFDQQVDGLVKKYVKTYQDAPKQTLSTKDYEKKRATLLAIHQTARQLVAYPGSLPLMQ